MNKYQVIETTYDGKTTYDIEAVDPTSTRRPWIFYSYRRSKEEMIKLCDIMNKPPPPPPVRKVIYP